VDSGELTKYIVNIDKELREIKGKLASEEKPLENIISDRLESVRCEICDKYCRFQADVSMGEADLELICGKCPLTRL